MSAPIHMPTSAGWPRYLMVCGIAGFLAAIPAAGQLAITEVQSAQSTTPALRGVDYWELTNFGDQPVSLTDCWFTDVAGFNSTAKNLAVLAGTNWIGPLDSIIFAISKPGLLTTPAEFRQWWGESDLRPDLKIYVAPWGFGFSQESDAVQLWYVTPSETTLLDAVILGSSDPGDTFTYDPTTGLLDRVSRALVDGAFRAATTLDVGSPGVTTGPVPLWVVEDPASVVVDGGSPATLTVRALGLPRPHYQWLFNGQPIPGEKSARFSIPNAALADAGDYSVEVSNGITNLLTGTAHLTVMTNPSCARIVRSPADTTVTPDQTASFSVETRGYPLPTIQWQFDGVDIPGATANEYLVVGADASRVGLYTVRVSNTLCATNAAARLNIAPPPDLMITEAMAKESTNTTVLGHDDWWELTNFGTNAVNLRGYRFDDLSATLQNAVEVTNDVVVPPGKSVVWLSAMKPEAFRRWWGAENLPEDLEIISYPGNGFGAPSKDQIVLWNATARTDDGYLISYGVLDQSVPPTQGVSLLCDPDFGDCGIPSVEGEHGAFRAVESDDIGSPGWTSNEQRAAPRYLSIRRDAAGLTLRWKAEPGRTYIVQHCTDLALRDWQSLMSLTATGAWLSTTNPAAAGAGQHFSRVLLQPLAP